MFKKNMRCKAQPVVFSHCICILVKYKCFLSNPPLSVINQYYLISFITYYCDHFLKCLDVVVFLGFSDVLLNKNMCYLLK